jgi:hypothetical protein
MILSSRGIKVVRFHSWFFHGVSRQSEGYFKIFHTCFLIPRLSTVGIYYILTVIEDDSRNAESLNVTSKPVSTRR